jgi:3-oxoacyl-[acyl-carrier protein] reductase
MRSLSKEVGRSGIRVNSVAPGYVETDMTSEFSDKQLQAIKKSVALRRLGTPQDVANAVKFLHSDGASYITGQTLIVDGGTQI